MAEISLQARIEYLEAAVECAWIMRAEIEPRGFDSIRDRQKLSDHIDDMLESLLTLYLERAAA